VKFGNFCIVPDPIITEVWTACCKALLESWCSFSKAINFIQLTRTL
jgi:hypothetical protein